MEFDKSQGENENVPVKLPNGSVIKVEVAARTGREDVAFNIYDFQPLADAIEGIAQMIEAPLKKVKPKKATVKLGLELAIEAGQLTAAIVKGSGKGNLEITLEWEATVKD